MYNISTKLRNKLVTTYTKTDLRTKGKPTPDTIGSYVLRKIMQQFIDKINTSGESLPYFPTLKPPFKKRVKKKQRIEFIMLMHIIGELKNI